MVTRYFHHEKRFWQVLESGVKASQFLPPRLNWRQWGNLGGPSFVVTGLALL